MPQRGEMVVERLTGNRAIVIRVESPEEVTCRFCDGRLEYRYTFEIEPPPTPPLGSLISLLLSPFTLLLSVMNRPRERTSARVRRPLPEPPLGPERGAHRLARLFDVRERRLEGAARGVAALVPAHAV
ncbi:MAG: hypothetical protein E6J79_13610 [Deltaproteobacteria bacterium]|nr:MAG: hypothetical protein E6J79_13610 [Deltaproteobacteria bacterium]